MIRDYDILVNKLKNNGACTLTTDSRAIKGLKADGRKVMFIALKGENFDGNDFIREALEDGADYVVTQNDIYEDSDDSRIFTVTDTLAALQGMALSWRRRVNPKVIGITGSNGKTTTKELTAAIVAKKFKVWATQGNLNNHIGVPVTLLSMPEDCEVAVIEMGASHKGEIKQLCAICEPDMGVITNIGNAHLDGFGGPEGVRKGKGELIDALRGGGKLFFYLAEDKTISEMVQSRINVKSIPYSVKGVKATTEEDGTLSVKLPDFYRPIRTKLTGGYNKYNIISAIAIGKKLGIELGEAVEAIEEYVPQNNRSQIIESASGNSVIADSYNANPSSFESALRALDERAGKKVVIAGQMNELGAYSAEEHKKLVDRLKEMQLDRFFLVGENFKGMDKGKNGVFCDSVEELRKELTFKPIKDSVVLVKGSRAVGLEKIYDLL